MSIPQAPQNESLTLDDLVKTPESQPEEQAVVNPDNNPETSPQAPQVPQAQPVSEELPQVSISQEDVLAAMKELAGANEMDNESFKKSLINLNANNQTNQQAGAKDYDAAVERASDNKRLEELLAKQKHMEEELNTLRETQEKAKVETQRDILINSYAKNQNFTESQLNFFKENIEHIPLIKQNAVAIQSIANMAKSIKGSLDVKTSSAPNDDDVTQRSKLFYESYNKTNEEIQALSDKFYKRS